MNASSGGICKEKKAIEWLVQATSVAHTGDHSYGRNWTVLGECVASEAVLSSLDESFISVTSLRILQNLENVITADVDQLIVKEALRCVTKLLDHPRPISHLTTALQDTLRQSSVFLDCILKNWRDGTEYLPFCWALTNTLKQIRRNYVGSMDFVCGFLEHLLTPFLLIKCELEEVNLLETEDDIENLKTNQDAAKLEVEIEELIVSTVYQPNMLSLLESLFKILFENHPPTLVTEVEVFVSSLTSVFERKNVPLSNVMIGVMLRGAAARFKKNVFRILVMMCHMLRINPKLNDKPLIECGKLPRVVNLKTKRRLLLLNSILQCFCTLKLDGGSEMKGVSLNSWLQALADYLLKEVEERPSAWMESHALLLTISPSSVETRLLLFLKECLKIEDMDSSQRRTFGNVLCTYLETFSKMRRLPKFITWLLKAVRDRAHHDSESEKWASLPEKFLELFGKKVRELPPASILELWKILISDTSPRDTNGWKGGKLVIQVAMSLFVSFLNYAPVADHSWPEGRSQYVNILMKSTSTDVIEPIAHLILRNEHDMCMSQSFLELVWSWGELHVLLMLYGRGYKGKDDSLVYESSRPLDLSFLHPILTADEWAQIATRVRNFGQEKCHLTLCKLIFQKLVGMSSVTINGQKSAGEAMYLINNMNVCLPFIAQNFDVLLPLLSTEQLESATLKLVSSEHAEALIKNVDVMDSSAGQAVVVHTLVTEELGRCVCRVKRRYREHLQATTAHSLFSTLIGQAQVLMEHSSQDLTNLDHSTSIDKLLRTISERLLEGLTKEPCAQGVSPSLNALTSSLVKIESLPLEHLIPSCQAVVLVAMVTVINHLRETDNISDTYIDIKEKCYLIMKRVLDGGLHSSVLSYIPCSPVIRFLQQTEVSWSLVCRRDECNETYQSILRSLLRTSVDDMEDLLSDLSRALRKGHPVDTVVVWTCAGVVEGLQANHSWIKSGGSELESFYDSLKKSYRKCGFTSHEPYFICFGSLLSYRTKRKLEFLEDEKNLIQQVLDDALVYLKAATCSEATKAAVSFLQCLLKCVESLQLEMDHAQVLEVLKECVKKAHISADVYADVIRNASAAQFDAIVKQLIADTVISSDNLDPQSSLPCYLQIWSSILRCQVAKSQASTLAEGLNVLLPVMQQHLMISQDMEGVVLPILHMSVGILEHQSMVLAPQVKWLLVVPCTRSDCWLLEATDQQLAQCFPLLCRILNDMLLYHTEVVAQRVAGFLQGLRSILRALTCRSHQERHLDEHSLQVMLSCARLIERLCQTIVKEKRDFDKVLPYVVADFVEELQKYTIYPKIKEVLISCIYLLLDGCSEFCVGELRSQLNVGPRELFLHLHAEYIKLKQSQEKT